jgi:hypothetical protein
MAGGVGVYGNGWEQQIPCGDDSKKGKSKGEGNGGVLDFWPAYDCLNLM